MLFVWTAFVYSVSNCQEPGGENCFLVIMIYLMVTFRLMTSLQCESVESLENEKLTIHRTLCTTWKLVKNENKILVFKSTFEITWCCLTSICIVLLTHNINNV